jgi:hypothetical protein
MFGVSLVVVAAIGVEPQSFADPGYSGPVKCRPVTLTAGWAMAPHTWFRA